MFDPALEQKLQSIFAEWEAEDAPPAAEPAEKAMEFPAMDLTESEPLRLRPPPPPEAPSAPKPATVPPGAVAPTAGPQAIAKRGPTADLPPRISGGRDPSPKSGAPDWADLQRRLTQANIAKSSSKAYENMFANVAPGYKPNAAAGNVGVDVAQLPLGMAKERQGYESRDLAAQGAKQALGAKAADVDPNSLQSQKARNAFRSFFGGSVKEPAGFDNWSAADIKAFAGSGDMSRLLATKNAAEDDARKVAGAKLKAEGEANELAAMRKNWRQDLMDSGIDPDTATREDLKMIMSKRHAMATEKVAESNNRIALAGRKDKDEDKEARGSDVPFAGVPLHYVGKGAPREDDRREVQKHASLYGAAIAGMDDLGKALDEFARHPSPETKDDVASKANVVSGHLNTASGQGAMSKDEVANMSAALGTDMLNPTGFQAFVQRLTGDDAAAAKTLTRKLRSVRETARNSAMGKIRAYNYDAPAAIAAPPGGSVRTWRNKKTGKAVQGTEEQLKASKSPGDWEPVDG